jgi:hypothetical protein
MLPEVFIHYLEHRGEDWKYGLCRFLPELPKRLTGRLTGKDGDRCGWDIHIKQGPNREVISTILFMNVIAGTALAICWAVFTEDMQGGMGIGALVLVFPTVVMVIVFFRFGDRD